MNKNNLVLISDFDGTITQKDFFYHIAERALKKDDLMPWNEYKNGKITHFDALKQIFEKVHTSEDKLKEIILEIPLEQGFLETVSFCADKNIDFYIVSAGADYYINILLNKYLADHNLKVIANPSHYNYSEGLKMTRPDKTSNYYSYNIGIDKESVIKQVKTNNNYIIFAGDGRPDYNAAIHADKVFARKDLEEMCIQNNLKHEKLQSYHQILNFLEQSSL